ncbi:MAG TPA: hypothetical protein VET23_14250, partial [Chitinophagaceae bacterium]|nr:hypothetical protein [Chitinophagaceae bacterium]
MIRQAIAIIFLIIATEFASAQNTIHFKIGSLPSYHPSNSEIYLAGSFNGWNPQDKKFKFSRDENG